MRFALVAAVLAGCLAMPAFAVMPTVNQGAAASPNVVGPDQDFRLYANKTPVSAQSAVQDAHHLRFEKKMLEYYPLANSGFHLEAGFQREKRGVTSGPAFNFRGDKLFGVNNLGFHRKVAPGFAVAYDKPVSAHDKFNLDAGMRFSRDGYAGQLIRLAALGPDENRLGARAARFGPAAHLSFIHSF